MRMALMLQQQIIFTTNSTISANDLTISANSFVNNHTRGDGNINANTLTLLLIGDFDYTNRGTITTTTLNLQLQKEQKVILGIKHPSSIK